MTGGGTCPACGRLLKVVDTAALVRCGGCDAWLEDWGGWREIEGAPPPPDIPGGLPLDVWAQLPVGDGRLRIIGHVTVDDGAGGGPFSGTDRLVFLHSSIESFVGLRRAGEMVFLTPSTALAELSAADPTVLTVRSLAGACPWRLRPGQQLTIWGEPRPQGPIALQGPAGASPRYTVDAIVDEEALAASFSAERPRVDAPPAVPLEPDVPTQPSRRGADEDDSASGARIPLSVLLRGALTFLLVETIALIVPVANRPLVVVLQVLLGLFFGTGLAAVVYSRRMSSFGAMFLGALGYLALALIFGRPLYALELDQGRAFIGHFLSVCAFKGLLGGVLVGIGLQGRSLMS